MGWYGARGAGDSKTARADARRLRLSTARYRVAELTAAQKTALLARAIAEAAARRSEVSLADCTRAGLTEREARNLYDEALLVARRIDPALLGAMS